MVRAEITCKHVRQALHQCYPSAKFFTDRQQGTTACQWKRLIRISIPSATPTIVMEFFANDINALGFDLAAIRSARSFASAPQRDNLGRSFKKPDPSGIAR
eukprot:7281395-Pyramimonas_sp.AAC.1